MSLSLKQGVRVHGLSTPILIAIIVAEGVYAELGYDLVVTAGIDGKHTDHSSHYSGNAVDLRTNILPEIAAQKALAKLQQRLTEDYFCQIEVDHIHIQFRPLATYGV